MTAPKTVGYVQTGYRGFTLHHRSFTRNRVLSRAQVELEVLRDRISAPCCKSRFRVVYF